MKLTKCVLSVACAAMACHAYGQIGLFVESLGNDAWEAAQWISAKDAPVVTESARDGLRAADGASWMLLETKNDKEVAKAEWMTTALGTYDLYVNGNLIGEEILKPGFTHAQKTRRAFTYDVTEALKCRKGDANVFAAEVTPGWWADKIITPWGHEGMVGKKPAFRGVLKITYKDGTSVVIGTDDKNWKAGVAGKVTHAAIFDGESYDARKKDGWLCAAQFDAPEINQEFNGEILPTAGAEIYLREDLAMTPVSAYVWEGAEGSNDQEYGKIKIKREYGPGNPMRLGAGETLVLDFGQNCAALPRFAFSAKEGTRLLCEVGELLNDGNGAKSRGMDGPEGSVHRLNLRVPDVAFKVDYTFANSVETEVYMPRHTFFGYRYLSITADNDVDIVNVVSVPVSSITPEMEIGCITTGNESVNKLIQNTIWGMRSNYLSVPTDCPQRNERLGWTADTQVFAETGSFFARTKEFFHKWLRDLRDSQDPLGGFPGVAPDGQYGWEKTRLGWSDVGVIVPWTVWKQFGDAQAIEESWESMERYIDHIFANKYDHVAHKDENGNYQWADWLSYEPLESCGGGAFDTNGPLPEAIEYWSYLSACYLMIDAQMMADMARATGRDAEKYEKMAQDTKDYVLARFFTPQGDFKTEILNTMQTPALFALRNQLFEGAKKEKIAERLRQNFKDHGNCLQTGFLGTSILMPTLTENGMNDIAYELLFQRKNPSWLYSIDNGATTIWERWNSYMIEHGMGPQGMNSFNHYAYGCVCQWLWETAAGISADTAAPGFKHIIMAPKPDRRLGHLHAKYASASGDIESSWKYDGDEWKWTIAIPEGTTATVTLPGEDKSFEVEAGTYDFTKSL